MVDAIDVVLDGIFERNEIDRIGIELADHRVHGGTLTRSCGADDQNHAVARVDERAVFLEIAARQTDSLGLEKLLVFIEQADNHRFAVDGRQR